MAVITIIKEVKKITIILLINIIVLTTIIIYTQNNNTEISLTNNICTFAETDDGLYATIKSDSNQSTWQKWQSYNGTNAKKGCKYFFVPKSVNDNYIIIYNNYSKDIKVGNRKIKSKETKKIKFTEGKEITVSLDGETCTLLILKSDAEASVFINDFSKAYKDYKGDEVSTDLYSFLIQDKKNSVKDAKCTIVSDSGVLDTTLKKIKGRGNSTWYEQNNKPFNITFYDKTLIGHTLGKKFAIVSNGCDATMLRNKVMYDLANEVELSFSPDISYIDLFVNGDYKGCYLACEKVDLGKNSLVSLKDNSDKLNSNFNFLVEVDCWNYDGDIYFSTDRGYKVVLKTPDLDEYNENDENMKSKFDFIKNTYQNFENILYNGTLEELEKICDIESLAKMYLIQELGKNCDGGFTSTYFTYNAEEKKFYAAPIWDFDASLGSIDEIKEGYTLSTCNYKGWLTRAATYNGVINPFGQCFKISGKTSDGENFEEICKSIWNEKFMTSINILLGKDDPNGKLKSIDQYKSNCEKAMYNNYIMWKFRWYCPSYASRIGKQYSKDFNGEVEYLEDWIELRSNWINSMLNHGYVEEKEKTYYLTGENLGGWGSMNEDNKLVSNGDGTYSITKIFKANVKYEFKVIDSQEQYYYGNYLDKTSLQYSKIDRENLNVSFTYENDTELTILLDGDYFKVIPTKGKENTFTPVSTVRKEIYFKDALGWENVYYYGHGNKYKFASWPGFKAEFVKKDDDGLDIYKAEIFEDDLKVIFNNGGIEEKTEDIDVANYIQNSIIVPKDYTIFRTFKVFNVEVEK